MANCDEIEVVITFEGETIERVFYADVEWSVIGPEEDLEWEIVKLVESFEFVEELGEPNPPLTDSQRKKLDEVIREKWDDKMEGDWEAFHERLLDR